MQLRILNCPDLQLRPFVERAAHFYLNLLVTKKRLRNNLKVTVKFTKKINVLGYASITGYNTRNEPREFEIEINSTVSAATMLKVLAHECVHIKQYINKETNDKLNKWQGQPVNSDEIDYWEQPWEIEAHGREPGLFVKFAIEEKLWDVFEGVKNPLTEIEKESIGWKRPIPFDPDQA